MDLVCGTDGYWGTEDNQICFEVRLFSDNTGSNQIQSLNLPLLISGSNIVSVDTSIGSAFSGSVVGHFEILAVTKHGDPDPAVAPFHVSYSALSLSQFPTGNGTAFKVCLTVNDTGTICLDTLSSSQSDFPLLTTGSAIGFVPGWGGSTGQGYPPGGICCQVGLCTAIPGDANADGAISLPDVVSVIRYVLMLPPYPEGCTTYPSYFCWLSNLLCRGDWNGSNSVTLGDVIRGVNYIFNKPNGPWDPVPLGECCQPLP